MSGKCDKCGEHALECVCDDESLTTCSEFPTWLQVKKSRNERVGYIPYGFELDEDGIHLKVNDDEQYTLKLMNQMRSEGDSLRQISEQLNFFKRMNRKGPWNHVSVKRVMK